MSRRVVRVYHARLALVRLREGVAALLPHALHLANLSDRLLELLHPVSPTLASCHRRDDMNIVRAYLGR